MLLCIDIGNTNIVLGLFQGQELVANWRLSTVHDATMDEYGLRTCGMLDLAGIPAGAITGIAMCSVVPRLTETFDQMCRQYLSRPVFLVEPGVELGIRLLVDRPPEVGTDRIVNCVAARARFGGPACIVDFGTATKFDALSAGGDFLGGAIAPGLGISAEALFSRASRLYRVALAPPARVIGRNTVEAMQSGVFLGYISMVDGMVRRFREVLGPDMKVIATGGLSPMIAPETESIQATEPWLTLEGLRLIYDMN